eukprot:960805-Lingulodinium_polyedra.AAC.1
MVLFRASWTFPLAQAWGARPVRVSERLSSNIASPRAPVFVPVPSAGLAVHSQAFERAQWLIPAGVATAVFKCIVLDGSWWIRWSFGGNHEAAPLRWGQTWSR